MKKLITLILLLKLNSGFATATITENQKLESLAKVWGFLKYYHPSVASGKLDWDAVLFQKIAEVRKAKNQHELSQLYTQWLTQLGTVKPCRSCNNNLPDSLTRNFTFGWLRDSSVFTPALSRQLLYLKENRHQGKNYYVEHSYKFFKTQASFKNEKLYEDLPALPTEEYRLLGLFRYWNIINYFFPYKYAIDESWDKALADLIPVFKNASTPQQYHLAMSELSNRIQDGHNFFQTNLTQHYFGPYYAPFRYKIIQGKAVVTSYYNEDFGKASGVKIGDAITQVNGHTIMDELEPKLKYITGSNLSYKLNNEHTVFNGHTDTLHITVERDGQEYPMRIRRNYLQRFGYLPPQPKLAVWQMLSPEIGYVDLGRLQKKDVRTAMQAVLNASGIILDVRGYPESVIGPVASYLKPMRSAFSVMTYPDLKYPGVFRPNTPLKAGRKNKDYYKGKVVLLVDEGTMSAGEFTTMALQTAPNAITIGRPTAGADGNITYIPFPGGFKASMSGLGVYYPDGRETQRIGIVPDIVVQPTIESIKKGEDEILERALTYLSAGK